MNKKDKATTKNTELSKKIEMENNHKTQTRKMKEEIGDIESGNIYAGEDVTKYGEFVSSYFAWLTLENQKKKAKDMENMTDGK